MVAPFTYQTSPSRIVFGAGKRHEIAGQLDTEGVNRALVLSTPNQCEQAEAVANDLGGKAVGIFSGAAMHTPTDVTEVAMQAYHEAGADCVVAVGGGSTTGLGKAIAYRNDATQFVIPTTYAGSEVTPILGQTENGIKTTVRSASILPEVVIYDPELTFGLPVAMSVSSGLNAMAHAVEALYAQDRNPISSMMAVEGIRALKCALPRIVHEPSDKDARADALYGAWLCGTVLGAVGMALHHKLCHTLGGSFDLPHAETHAILLPHTAAYNETVAREALKPAAALFGGCLGVGLYELAEELGAPMALGEIGLAEDDLNRAADLAVKNPYWNPREVSRNGVHALLSNAYAGRAPTYDTPARETTNA